MKNKLQNWKNLLCLAGLSFCLVSCIKDDVEDLKDEGATVVKLLGGGGDATVKAMDADPPVETINVLDVRRDANSQAMLNQSSTVTITNTQDFLDAYNTEHGTHYELLPAAAYTITTESGVTVSGDTWTINLAPGEFARSIDVSLDKSKMDLSKQYALAFQITQTTSGVVSEAARSQIVNPLVKNKYDGVYDLTITTTGWSAFNISDGVPGAYGEVALATSGSSSVVFENHVTHTNLQPGIDATGAITQFGNASPIFTFDLATNKITSVVNAIVDPAPRSRNFILNPAAPPTENVYDPSTKNIIANYLLRQTGRPDMVIRMEMEFVGPR